MLTIFIGLAAWTAASVVLGLAVGRVIAVNDRRRRPATAAGPRRQHVA